MGINKVGIIGAGSWGTALANRLAKNGVEVRIWDLDSGLLDEINENRENVRYLPGVKLHDSVTTVAAQDTAVSGADLALFAVPAQHFRSAAVAALPFLSDDVIVLNVAKGIECGSLQTISQIAADALPDHPYAVLSGPSHAEEVAHDLPTTVAVASKYENISEKIQSALFSDVFRVYTNSDVLGLELGGSLKNIIALGAGISDGMCYGDNTKAALMTRGLAEMTRLGVRLGAKADTFSGLAGIGDLIVTCTSMHSRNRRCGIMIGEGIAPDVAIREVGMVVEGITTAEAAYELAQKYDVEMPITEAIYNVVNGQLDPKKAINELMQRDRTSE